MDTTAVILHAPGRLALGRVGLIEPGPGDLVVEIGASGISTGTERLFWTGRMPPFPGMGYPLVPGYEAAGEVVEAAPETGFRTGEHVFVPGAACYREAKGLFGGSARRIVTSAARAVRIDRALGDAGALLALAATARHALAASGADLPDLIVGHGVLGRLLARLTLAAGAPPPTVWETDPARTGGVRGYEVTDAEADLRRDYRAIYDASGRPDLLDVLIGQLAKGGEIVLAGFYDQPLAFAFPPAFMKEARLRVAAEWNAADMAATKRLVESGALALDGLVTHRAPAEAAAAAYETAFTDPACLKMILDWKDVA